MIIDELSSLPLPVQSTDELPIERGELAYKVTYNNLFGSEIAGVKSNITTLQGNVTTLQNADSKIESSIAIIVNGNTTSTTISAGQYVYIKGNTVLAEGLYTANTAVPSGTVITAQTAATYFTAVSGGGLNAIQQSLAIVQEWTPVIPRITMSDITKNKLIKSGNIVYCFATFKVVTAQNANVYIDATSFPTFDKTRGICNGVWTDSTSANDECGLIVGAVNLNGWLKYGTGSAIFTGRVGHTVTISLSYPIF